MIRIPLYADRHANAGLLDSAQFGKVGGEYEVTFVELMELAKEQ